MNSTADIQLDVQIASATPGLPDAGELRHWVEQALLGSSRPRHEHATELTVRIVDEAESADLNQRYRGKAGPTNVLSFPAELPPGLPMDLLGDLVVCAPVVVREAIEQHKPVAAHWAHMIVHGVLHLCGYDHIDAQDAQQMENLEIDILSTLNFANPYPDMEDRTQSHG